MKLFINNNPLSVKKLSEIKDFSEYEVIIEQDEKIDYQLFKDDVLLLNPTIEQVDMVIRYLYQKYIKGIESITFAGSSKKYIKKTVKKQFTIIKAAGGLVVKDDKFLLIYRQGKWDLPKGKLERGEKTKKAAIREVEEECNIRVKRGPKICSTWHTYTRNNKKVLKKNSWYLMTILDEKNMAPQTEEDIEEVRWLLPREANHALYNSYPSIRYVFRQYYKMIDKTKPKTM
jgi:8-oxo-(d)GTP phosphatase